MSGYDGLTTQLMLQLRLQDAERLRRHAASIPYSTPPNCETISMESQPSEQRGDSSVSRCSGSEQMMPWG